mmetsp:Transcript_110655/g.309264  ORF Transcript_110655/g.309264 Transcript_110655/m.309264 type:complete len:350 (-) Transcript_110655:2-1051(-)
MHMSRGFVSGDLGPSLGFHQRRQRKLKHEVEEPWKRGVQDDRRAEWRGVDEQLGIVVLDRGDHGVGNIDRLGRPERISRLADWHAESHGGVMRYAGPHHNAGHDCMHRDGETLVPHLGAQARRESRDCMLGGAVHRDVARPQLSRHRADVHDMATRLENEWQECPRQVDQALEVDIQHGVDLFKTSPLEMLQGHYGGVVHQDDLACVTEPLPGDFHELRLVLVDGDVGPDGVHPGARIAARDGARDALQLRLGPRGQDHLGHACLGQAPRDVDAEARGGPGHDSALPPDLGDFWGEPLVAHRRGEHGNQSQHDGTASAACAAHCGSALRARLPCNTHLPRRATCEIKWP